MSHNGDKSKVSETLASIGFGKKYIKRAIKVAEFHNRNNDIQFLREIIIRLQKKDLKKKTEQGLKKKVPNPINNQQANKKRNKKRKHFKVIKPFISHMTVDEADQLKVNDMIDHRDSIGRFCSSIIKSKKGTNLLIHYDGWDKIWDKWSDYKHELYRFAQHESISNRSAHRFKELKIGNYIDINPIQHNGWRGAEIRSFDQKSGQIKVVYEELDKNYLIWTHIDNVNEIAQFKTMNINNNIDRFSRNKYEKIENKYNIGDELEVKDVNLNQWFHCVVKYKQNNWIVVHFSGWSEVFDKKFHVINDKNKLREVTNLQLDNNSNSKKEINEPLLKKRKLNNNSSSPKSKNRNEIDKKIGQLRIPVNEWNHYRIIKWLNRVDNGKLNKIRFYPLRKSIKSAQIKGYELSNINDFTLRMIGINNIADRKLILKYLIDLTLNKDNYTAMNDDDDNDNNNTTNVPDHYCDPISYELMNDPVLITISGHTYERKFIEKYIKENKKDPITFQSVQLKDIVPNRALREGIEMWNKRKNSP